LSGSPVTPKCLGHDLVEVPKLDIVALHDVEVIHPQPCQALVHAGRDARGREIKHVGIIAPDLGLQVVAIARDAAQRFAQHRLGDRPSIVGCHVDKVDPQVERRAHGADPLCSLSMRRNSLPSDEAP